MNTPRQSGQRPEERMIAMWFRDLCTVHSNRFNVDIDYYLTDLNSYEDGHIEIAWGCSADDGRAYYLTFVDGVFDDSETEVA